MIVAFIVVSYNCAHITTGFRHRMSPGWTTAPSMPLGKPRAWTVDHCCSMEWLQKLIRFRTQPASLLKAVGFFSLCVDARSIAGPLCCWPGDNCPHRQKGVLGRVTAAVY
jgi:hypothetical protein